MLPCIRQSWSWTCDMIWSRKRKYCLISAFKGIFSHLSDCSERELELSYSFVSSEQLVMHVLAYAEALFRWKLLHKRIELLKAVDPFLRMTSDSYFNSDHSQLGTLFALCPLLVPLPIMWSSDRCIHPVHSVQSTDDFSYSIDLLCLWHPYRNA